MYKHEAALDGRPRPGHVARHASAYARWLYDNQVVRLAEQQPENPNLTAVVTAAGTWWVALSADLVPIAAHQLN